MLWACIDLPRLALDAALRRAADPAHPLALVTGPAQLRCLHAVNDAAMHAGLQPGMRLATAQALCPRLALVEHDPREAARWHRFLAAWAYRHSSLVDARWPDAIVLEARASFRLFGPWPRFAARLRAELQALGFAHRIALAPTPRAARVFAAMHDGLAVAHADAMRRALDGIAVQHAQLPDDAGTRLRRMGIATLGALRALPDAALRRRFGAALPEHIARLYGEADDPPDCYRPPDRFESRIELGYEVESHQALLFPLRRLLGDLAVYLSARDGGVQRFVLRMEHAQGRTELPIGLLAAERDAGLLFDIARSRMEQAALPAPVVALWVLARELPPFVPAARDLFDARPSQALPWPQLRERLRARLGDHAVHRIAAAGDPRPEHAWCRVEGDGDTRCAMTAPPRPPRPAWLLSRPQPLRDRRLRIVSGPERLESGWWDGEDARRDYYVVETTQGQRAWAFVPAGEHHGWMLHGWFA